MRVHLNKMPPNATETVWYGHLGYVSWPLDATHHAYHVGKPPAGRRDVLILELPEIFGPGASKQI